MTHINTGPWYNPADQFLGVCGGVAAVPFCSAGVSVYLSIRDNRGRILVEVPLTPVIGPGTVPGMEARRTATDGASDDSRGVVGSIRPDRFTISEALTAWAQDMTRRGCKPSTIKRFDRDVRRLAEFTGWATIDQLALAGAVEYLAGQREAGWSGTTHDAVASAIRCFGDFLRKIGSLPVNPLEHLESTGDQSEPGARALTTEEARAIIAAACRPERRGRAKCPRSIFYLFLCLTGLRYMEAARCCWRDIDLDGDPPAIYTDPKWAKNRTRMRVCLCPELIGILRSYRQSVPNAPGDRVFPSTPNRHTWQEDRERAGIPAEDGRGRGATFHSCRKWLATELDRLGTTPGVVARIIRHADGLTQKKYIDPPAIAEVSAMQRLPLLWPEAVPNPVAVSRRKTVDRPPPAPDTQGAKDEMVEHPLTSSDSVLRAPARSERRPSQFTVVRPGALQAESKHAPFKDGNGHCEANPEACLINEPSGDFLDRLGSLATRVGREVTLRDVLTIARWAREERPDVSQ